ncbi:helix-turn-helix domain-containing protein [Rhizobiales bacterium]|uniref:helix-turn-helix domain-containing protein n=1 Tax=Hongsoonwoonella zoysiae TaxID=2821844 RepID=UPI00155F896F|nr:helix-turn-helix domain-containing protein [Hongsoonwoonella zoysiae]NRG16672.1 helix-turn-helix domain-containing protein [Hongsoonwoonella zoysiae]
MNRAFSKIPEYGLYGEPAGLGLPDVLHVESISARSGPRRWRISTHRHAALHQIFWIESGGGVISFSDMEKSLTSRTVINIPAGIVHGFRFTPQTEGAVITVPLEVFEPIRAELDPGGLLSCPALRSGIEENPPALAEMFAEHGAVRPFRAGALKAHAGLIAAWAARQIAPQALSLETGDNAGARLLGRFQALVEHRFTEKHSPSDYADALGVTTAHLTRICREGIGKPASQVLRDRQMLEARRLLAYTQMTVAEVAERLGFSDPGYFSRLFSGEMGLSPRAFRRGFTDRAP